MADIEPETRPEPKQQPLSHYVATLNQLALGVAALCYVAGFVVTNLYLGSLGVVKFELLHVRYISVGILFLVFAGTIALPAYGSIGILIQQRDQNKPALDIFWQIIKHSVGRCLLVYAIVTLLGSLVGPTHTLPIGIPQLSPPQPWTNWFATQPLRLLSLTVPLFILTFGVVIVIALLVQLVILIANPQDRDGIRSSRGHRIRSWLDWARNPRNIIKILSPPVWAFAAMYMYFTMSSLLTFIRTNQAGSTTSSGSLISDGLVRFIGASLIMYIFVVAYVAFILSGSRSSDSKRTTSTTDLDPLERIPG